MLCRKIVEIPSFPPLCTGGGEGYYQLIWGITNEHDITQASTCYREDDDVRYGDAVVG
ncbi:MAG: hypothetical protein LBR79_04830 [Oscillospiraceae bacterium]|jgi:hypothetical protein|nr:hypothetical protein [Oscillospiraceae bacterium]